MRTKKNMRTKTMKGKEKGKNKTRNRRIKMKGGNNPFSDIFGMWGTMTYNLSNAFSVFNITPPTAYMNQPSKMDPSPGKQFV
jgi:hypothetical protein